MTPDTQKDEFLRVRKIESGIVIDHIPQGNSLRVARILGLDESNQATVSLLMNVPSSSTGLKDIIKIEGRELSERELERIALVAPSATLNVIRGYVVAQKFKAKLPEVVEDVVPCPNPTCISNKEGRPRLHIREHSPLKLQCDYCEKVYSEDEFSF
ncbi:aspartate carbamoyltransferase regulatory subunit [Candidatus Micrarchaeota archaeon]|nr:aspartate carbamoyltransferase regulatory subunit [Candidatus Micrarchaeota archaeon]